MPQELWCRVTVVGSDRAKLASGVLEGTGMPDIGTVDDVARLALLAKRLGGALVLAEVTPALRALLELTGLRVQVEGEPEGGKQPLRVDQIQEERHVGDFPV
jgi:hypothetical protein